MGFIFYENLLLILDDIKPLKVNCAFYWWSTSQSH